MLDIFTGEEESETGLPDTVSKITSINHFPFTQTLEGVMKKVLVTIALATFAVAAVAQDGTQTKSVVKNAGDLDAMKIELQAKIGAELDNLPADVQAKVQEAKAAMEQVKDQLKTMSWADKSATMEQARQQAQEACKDAVNAMEQVNDQVKEQVRKAKAEIESQLQKREGKLNMIQAKSGTGEPKGEPVRK